MSDVLSNLAKSYAANKALLDQLATRIATHKGRGKAELLKQYHELNGVVSFIGRFITNHMTYNGLSGYIGTTSVFTKQKDGCNCCVEVTFSSCLDKEPSVVWKICSRCSNLEVEIEKLERDVKNLEDDIEDNEKVEESLRKRLREVAFREWLNDPDYVFDPTKRHLIAESGLRSEKG